jgi:hypothetical protein
LELEEVVILQVRLEAEKYAHCISTAELSATLERGLAIKKACALEMQEMAIIRAR